MPSLIVGQIYQQCFSKVYEKIYVSKSIEEIFANEILQINNWRHISRYYKLTEEFLETFKNKVNWNQILKNKNMTLKLIDKFADYMDWDYIMINYNFNNSDFLISNSYYIDWDRYFKFYELPDDFKIDI